MTRRYLLRARRPRAHACPALGLARRLLATLAGLVLCVGLVLAPACGSRTTGGPRERSLTVEGQVHQLVGAEAFRVGAPGSADRGILVLAIGRPQPRRLDTVRVVGVQHTLRLRELESVVRADLDAYRRYEGEEVLVADMVGSTLPA